MKRYIRAAYGPDAVEILHNALNNGNIGAWDVVDALVKYMKPSDIQRAAAELGLYNKIYVPKFEGHWSEDDKILWDSIDWKARDYKEYPVEDDTIEGKITIYGEGAPIQLPATFHKVIHANPIYDPDYVPAQSEAKRKEMLHKYAGPMYDGHTYKGYRIHDRYDTYEMYDRMSR